MAVKVALAAALLVALVAMATATTFTTTVTTTSFEDDASPQRQCSRQLQGRRFRACQSYLQQGRSSPYEEEEDVIEMSTNPSDFQNQCCQQLREVDQQGCGCEAIRQAVREVQQRGPQSQHRGQSEQIYQKARQLPSVCRLRSKQCQFHVVFV